MTVTSPDVPEDRAQEAATSIGQQVGRLWMEANTNGIRFGLDLAAQIVDGWVGSVRDELPALPEVADLLARLRDEIRLAAFQVPEPEMPDA